jgi:hypothetical protein
MNWLALHTFCLAAVLLSESLLLFRFKVQKILTEMFRIGFEAFVSDLELSFVADPNAKPPNAWLGP